MARVSDSGPANVAHQDALVLKRVRCAMAGSAGFVYGMSRAVPTLATLRYSFWNESFRANVGDSRHSFQTSAKPPTVPVLGTGFKTS